MWWMLFPVNTCLRGERLSAIGAWYQPLKRTQEASQLIFADKVHKQTDERDIARQILAVNRLLVYQSERNLCSHTAPLGDMGA